MLKKFYNEYMTEKEKRNLPTRKAKKNGKIILHWFEIGLGILTLAGVSIFTVYQIFLMNSFDWSTIEAFREVLRIILELAIGIEVARMLFSYNLNTLVELAVFIVIRKMLLLDGAFFDLLLGVISLVILFAARHFFINDDTKCQALEEKDE